MNKESQPEMWGHYDVSGVEKDAVRRDKLSSSIEAIQKIVDSPDAEEQVKARLLLGKNIVNELDLAIRRTGNGSSLVGDLVFGKELITVKIFNPHETVSASEGESSLAGMNYHTYVMAFDLFGSDAEFRDENTEEDPPKTGSFLAFRLMASMPGEPCPGVTVRGLSWGGDCSFGALITDNSIQWFNLVVEGDETVESEVRRNDVTEESGEKVEMRFVRKQEPSKKLQFIDPNDEKKLGLLLDLDKELDKFIASRRSS